MNKRFETIISRRCHNLEKDTIGKRYHHIAYLLKGKKCIQTACNDYERCYHNGKPIASLHAEVHLLHKSFRKNKSAILKGKGMDILVIRVDKTTGRICNSIPCSACKTHLLSHGFKHIYCSTGYGEIEKLKLSTLREYYSSSWKKVQEECCVM